MREVKFHSEERVDIPDMTAVSHNTVGEFRRMLRALVVGEANKVVRGYAVTAESPNTSRVKVTMNNLGTLSAAVSAEAQVSGTDYGVLLGNRDSGWYTEGADSQFVDFAGQPANTYYVEMSLLVSDGATDNRVFINPATLTEYTSAVATRIIYGWTARLVAAPTGGAWQTLATVVYGGGVIAAGNITDKRDFLLEAVYPWQQTTQTGTGGIPDFSRSTTRDLNGALQLVPAIRALMRQIQDIKGPTDGGKYDWFSYAHQPPGRAWGAGQTRNLRSMETVTFRIGDGVEDYADFNGTGGLAACLTYIQTNAATLPTFIKILILTRNIAADVTSKQVLSSTYSIANKQIWIEGVDSGGGTSRGYVQMANGATTYALTLTGTSKLYLRRMYIETSLSTTDRGLFSVAGGVDAEDCTIIGGTLVNPTVYAITANQADSRIVGCNVTGRVKFATGSGRKSITISGSDFFDAQVDLSDVYGARISDSTFLGRGYNNANTPYTTLTPNRALLDFGAAGYENAVKDCRFYFDNDENGIAMGANATRNHIANCQFLTTAGAHAAYAIDATYGTGWGIASYADQARFSFDRLVQNTITNCRFKMVGIIDAGGILVTSDTQTLIDHCVFYQATKSGTKGADIRVFGSHVTISDCQFGPHDGKIAGVVTNGNAGFVTIQGSTFLGDNGSGGAAIGTGAANRTVEEAAIVLDNSGNTQAITIAHNIFRNWSSTGAPSIVSGDGRCILGKANVTFYDLLISSNQFYGCQGYVMDFDVPVLLNAAVNGNVLDNPSDNNIGMTAPNASNRGIAFVGNVLRTTNALARPLLSYRVVNGEITMHSNVAPNRDIQRLSAAASDRGYSVSAGTSGDHNFVRNYT